MIDTKFKNKVVSRRHNHTPRDSRPHDGLADSTVCIIVGSDPATLVECGTLDHPGLDGIALYKFETTEGVRT